MIKRVRVAQRHDTSPSHDVDSHCAQHTLTLHQNETSCNLAFASRSLYSRYRCTRRTCHATRRMRSVVRDEIRLPRLWDLHKRACKSISNTLRLAIRTNQRCGLLVPRRPMIDTNRKKRNENVSGAGWEPRAMLVRWMRCFDCISRQSHAESSFGVADHRYERRLHR
jgi:hypothetical protein